MDPGKVIPGTARTDLVVLKALAARPYTTMAPLIEDVGMSRPTVRRALQRLDQQGCIRYRPGSSERNGEAVILAEGRAWLERENAAVGPESLGDEMRRELRGLARELAGLTERVRRLSDRA